MHYNIDPITCFKTMKETEVNFDIREIPQTKMAEYAAIPISFEYKRILQIKDQPDGLAGFALEEVELDETKTKDYDAHPGNSPLDWVGRFPNAPWGLFLARTDEIPSGAAAVVFGEKTMHLLEDRSDLAVLWDIRISPQFRNKGLGAKLFKHAELWAKQRGCTQMKIETQNINLQACKFYLKQGCKLGAINRVAYQDLANEIQLIWYKNLMP